MADSNASHHNVGAIHGSPAMRRIDFIVGDMYIAPTTLMPLYSSSKYRMRSPEFGGPILLLLGLCSALYRAWRRRREL
jgi:hypothetical protein